MNATVREYLIDLWNQHERAHYEMETSGEWSADLALLLGSEKVRITRMLLNAGYVNKGYIDPRHPKRCVWVYDPDEAAELIDLIDRPEFNSAPSA